MGLTLHRLTGSREGATLYHHAGMGISYTDVRCLTNTWAKSISLSHKKILPPGFKKQRSVHVTFDNSNGKQQTLTGDHTTHHTTVTIRYASEALGDDGELTSGKKRFQTKITPKKQTLEITQFQKKESLQNVFLNLQINVQIQNSSRILFIVTLHGFWLGILVRVFLQEVNESISIDEIKDVGSWTAFMKDTASAETMKCKLEYIPFPPTDNIVKWYTDMIIQLAEDLEINHVFVHTDEAIHSKMLMIMWLHERKYDKILPLIGAFHTLLVYLKVLYKIYACLGFAQW